MQYPSDFIKIINTFRKLPGIGSKTAERFAFALLDWPNQQLTELSELLATLKEKLQRCPECGCLMAEEKCPFCRNPSRDASVLCVTASIKEVFTIEQTHEYKGLYHVLGGLLSPIERQGPEMLALHKLRERIVREEIKEIVIALDSTLEGDATALYIKKELAVCDIKMSRLAFGLPMGSSLDYVDGGTLALALAERRSF